MSILVVEDNAVSTAILQAVLARLGLHEVVRFCSTAEEAMVAIDNGFSPSYALIDLGLPGIQGEYLCGWIRNRLRFAAIVVITAEDVSSIPFADCVIRKPYRLKDIQDVLKPAMEAY